VEPSPKVVLENEFNRPVFFINDAQAKALAEYRFGKAKGRQNVMVIHLGSGLGTGIILNGKPYFGTHGFSGEFSHIPVSDNGYLCHCGKRGCLETVASGIALTRYAVDGLKAGEMSVISSLVDGKLEDINYKTVIHAAARGDQFAIRGIQKIGLELGKGLAILVQILNPELIILGGKFSEAGRYLLNPIEQSLQQYTFPIIRDDVEIVLSSMGDKANLLGSVIHLMENVFEH
jgi:predicted NBD/HSP70 family sugar kinase